MEYNIYKLRFKTAVHLGENNLSKSSNVIFADTLFSALCTEAIKEGTEYLDEFVKTVKENQLQFSDCMPYIGDKYYIPKPVKKIDNGENGDSSIKKQYKKLKYIPIDQFDEYLNGKLDPSDTNKNYSDNIGNYEMKTSSAVRGLDETLPYHVQSFRFKKNSGLYLIVGFEDYDSLDIFDNLLDMLSYTGIGGKKSSGLGKFDIVTGKFPEEFKNRLSKTGKEYMTLAISLPSDNELETVTDNSNSRYILKKRSGFVESESYSDTFQRKKDIFMFQAGSCFTEKYLGDIFDVKGNGNHPVYRYGKPMWMEVTG